MASALSIRRRAASGCRERSKAIAASASAREPGFARSRLPGERGVPGGGSDTPLAEGSSTVRAEVVVDAFDDVLILAAISSRTDGDDLRAAARVPAPTDVSGSAVFEGSAAPVIR